MKWFGLTGGIASGKSTVAAMLRDAGVLVIDADQVAREVVEPGEPTLEALVEAFGDAILTAEGRLDRASLGERVFGDESARLRLNAITHPAIARRSGEKMQAAREAGEPFVVYDAALLVENRLHEVMDGVIVVDVPRELQLTRLSARDGLSERAAAARVDAQIDRETRLEHATWVVDNAGTLEATRARVDEVLAELRQRASATTPVDHG